jgi:hypothetical protein
MMSGGWQDPGGCGGYTAEDAMLLVKRIISRNRIVDGDATVTVANDEWITIRASPSRGDVAARDAGEQHLKHNSIGGEQGHPRPQSRSTYVKPRHSTSLRAAQYYEDGLGGRASLSIVSP